MSAWDELAATVQQRAGQRCEYCRMHPEQNRDRLLGDIEQNPNGSLCRQALSA